MRTYASCRVKRKSFYRKVNSRCFCWFPAAILVDSFCPPVWRLHTKLYKGAWNISVTNSETVGHKDLRLGQIVYILVFYNIHFLGFFHWTVSYLFFCAVFIAWQWKRRIKSRIVFRVMTRHYVSRNKRKYAKANRIHKSSFFRNISPIILKEIFPFCAQTTTLQQDDLFKRDNRFGAPREWGVVGGNFLIRA